jgi:hypothetical protein
MSFDLLVDALEDCGSWGAMYSECLKLDADCENRVLYMHVPYNCELEDAFL